MRSSLVFATLCTVIAAGPAVAQGDPSSDTIATVSKDQIIVTGRSLKQTGKDLATCLARQCPPDEDIAAALAHAENQFVYGQYKDSRTTLLKSIGRNRQAGGDYPIPVSDLLRANARVAEHLGEGDSYRLSILDMRDTLKKGLAPSDPRILAAQIEVGDSRAKLGYPDEALRVYQRTEREAMELGNPRIAGYAKIRQAIIQQLRAEQGDRAAFTDARDMLEEVAALNETATQGVAMVARVLLARMDRKDGSGESTEAIIRDFSARGGVTQPILLAFDPIRINSALADASAQGGGGLGGGDPVDMRTNARLSTPDLRDMWADIGFWVGGDGQVRDIEVLRSDGRTNWLKPVLASLKSRVYAPLRKIDDDVNPGFYMIERYSYTARWTDDVTGTRIRRRGLQPQIERIDLTPESYAPPLS